MWPNVCFEQMRQATNLPAAPNIFSANRTPPCPILGGHPELFGQTARHTSVLMRIAVDYYGHRQ